MDWCLTPGDRAAVTALRHQVTGYLSRHAEPGADLGDATLVFQELVANAVEHTTGPAWVQLSWLEEQPDVTIWDLGPGFDPADVSGGLIPEPDLDPGSVGRSPYDEPVPALLAEGGRGLFLVSHLAEELAVAARAGGGSRVQARLPVRRAASRSFSPPPVPSDALPALDEARPSGGFDRESFLRALVVQLSRAVEYSGGPDLGEEVVAEVGLAVGGQMEEEFRAAQALAGRLTPAEMADCYVRLKHAIDGGFYVLEVTEDRIVLGNTRCPFGNAVRTSPALCRMTSAVFGGIAARNHEAGAAVVLEERIAVGDPGCRVVVHLGEAPETTRRFAHRYPAPTDATSHPNGA